MSREPAIEEMAEALLSKHDSEERDAWWRGNSLRLDVWYQPSTHEWITSRGSEIRTHPTMAAAIRRLWTEAGCPAVKPRAKDVSPDGACAGSVGRDDMQSAKIGSAFHAQAVSGRVSADGGGGGAAPSPRVSIWPTSARFSIPLATGTLSFAKHPAGGGGGGPASGHLVDLGTFEIPAGAVALRIRHNGVSFEVRLPSEAEAATTPPTVSDRPADEAPGRPMAPERTWGDSVTHVEEAIREWTAVPFDRKDDGHMTTLSELYRMRAAALVLDVSMRRGGGA